VLDDARKALHDMELAVDAMLRGKSEEALRYLHDVQRVVAQIEKHLVSRPEAPEEPPSPVKGTD
jgi:hypothetical protein